MFLYRFLKSMQDNFYKLQKGGAQPHVYGKDFGEFQIPLPPLSV
jgi:restriction endonuclease S subunit